MGVSAKVPAGVVWVMLLMFAVALLGGILELWWLVAADVCVGAIVIGVLARRWGRRLSTDFETARAATRSRPYVEPVWPRWLKIADPKVGGLVMGAMALSLMILLVVAVVASKL